MNTVSDIASLFFFFLIRMKIACAHTDILKVVNEYDESAIWDAMEVFWRHQASASTHPRS